MASGPTVDWTKLLGTSGSNYADALTTGADGAVYLAGGTQGNLDGQTSNGGTNAFITKYNPDGTKVWTRLPGTSIDDSASALTTGTDGAVYLAGGTIGNLDGQVNQGAYDSFITKYNPDGTKYWSKLFGGADFDAAQALTIGADGEIYVAGYTTGNLNGQTNNGISDAFLIKLTDTPNLSFSGNYGTVSHVVNEPNDWLCKEGNS